jgi:hypothetical protein
MKSKRKLQKTNKNLLHRWGQKTTTTNKEKFMKENTEEIETKVTLEKNRHYGKHAKF